MVMLGGGGGASLPLAPKPLGKPRFVPPSEIHEVFISHIFTSLFTTSTRRICKTKLIASLGENPDSGAELLENS
jgi:hypothetical protein